MFLFCLVFAMYLCAPVYMCFLLLKINDKNNYIVHFLSNDVLC